ncbi:hypothetical protein PDQ36_29445 [Bacillus cereus]|nr:hypothetical protein [Bacillus cereus]
MLAIPTKFTPNIVRNVVEPDKPGVYALGNDRNGFKVGYVGRSDACLQSRLANHNYLYHFDYFIFKYAENVKDAFYFECHFWHASQDKQITNLIHPASPKNSRLKCPYCSFANGISKLFAM